MFAKEKERENNACSYENILIKSLGKGYQMEIKKYTNSNREAWNETIPIHIKNRKTNLKEKFKDKNYNTLDQYELDKLNQINVKDLSVAQLSCNNGRELISILRLGAKSGIGFDISDEVIKEANELNEIAKENCKFIQSDVYDIGEEYYNSFDLVYLTAGTLVWLPDLKKFFGIIAKMLKENGKIMIYEEHPILNVFTDDDNKDPLTIEGNYFRKEHWEHNSGNDYVGNTSYDSKTFYSFSHTLSVLFNSVIHSGVIIKDFTEYSFDCTGIYPDIAEKNI